MKEFYVKNEQELVKKLKDYTLFKEIYQYLMNVMNTCDGCYTTNIKLIKKEIMPTELFILYIDKKFYKSIFLDVLIMEVWEEVQKDFIIKTIKERWD